MNVTTEYKRIGEYSKKRPSVENCRKCFDCISDTINENGTTKIVQICDVTGFELPEHEACPYWE